VSLLETLYSAAVSALRPILPAFRTAPPKVSEAVEGRRAAAAAIVGWAERERDPFRPLLWLHAASAGELAGAIPVVDRVRHQNERIQLLVTYSSPSAEPVLPEIGADFAGYPPLETRAECRAAIEAARPDALVFAKLDAWPGLTRAAAEAGVPIGMINATVRPGSTRLRGPGRQLLVPSYGRLDAVGAVSESERERMERLGARPEIIRVTGDSSFERALERVARARGAAEAAGPRLPPPGEAVRLVAGSTWPEDERILIETVAHLRNDRASGADPSALDLVLVPHEPDAPAIGRIRDLCREHLGIQPRLWSEWDADEGAEPDSIPPDAPLIVDGVGFLAELYLECGLAWVGGGAGGEGLHSVVEPAAAGVPVLFGPVQGRWEARHLVELGAAVEVAPEDAPDVIRSLLRDPARRERMGRIGSEFVESGRGSVAAAAALVLDLIERNSAVE
jgi:3-deoxy-D-manno-octulosonic-acid transferase